jgi:hypothetical protein
MCFDKEDSLVDTPYSTDLVWQLIKEHFSITDRYNTHIPVLTYTLDIAGRRIPPSPRTAKKYRKQPGV